MKICIPIEKNEGLDSKPFNHFGSAPKFLVYDLENEVLSEISNGDLGHEHGNCQPMKALSNQVVDCVISAGIGQGAISKLNSMGIKVYKAAGNTALENIKLFKENRLEEFSINHTCSHNCNH
jgi:predicted Fe-Mo cluster-binding NifX family protein